MGEERDRISDSDSVPVVIELVQCWFLVTVVTDRSVFGFGRDSDYGFRCIRCSVNSAEFLNVHVTKRSNDLVWFQWPGLISITWSDFNDLVWFQWPGLISLTWFDFNDLVWFQWPGLISMTWFDFDDLVWCQCGGGRSSLPIDLVSVSGTIIKPLVQNKFRCRVDRIPTVTEVYRFTFKM